MPPKMSFVIPAHNAEATLPNCLKTIKEQKIDKEIIVVIDGKNAELERICQREKVKFFTIPHSGASVARNFGLKKARGDFIALLDSDVYLSKNWAKQVLENDFNKWDIITGHSANDEKELNALKKRIKNVVASFDNPLLVGNSAVFKKELKKIVWFDEDFIVGGEDWEIVFRLLKQNIRIRIDLKPRYKHKHRFNSQRKRVIQFLLKKIWFSYGDTLCYIKHRDVRYTKRLIHYWILPLLPFILFWKRLDNYLKRTSMEKIMNSVD